MKPILYLLSGVLVAPGFLFTLFLWLMTETIKDGARFNNLFKTLFQFLIRLFQLLDWAIWLVPLFVILWLTLAFLPHYRIWGALATSVIATVSLVGMFVFGGPGRLDDLFLPTLSFMGLLISLWLVWNAWVLDMVARG